MAKVGPSADPRQQQTQLHPVTQIADLGGGCLRLEVEGPIPETLAGQFYMLRTEHGWPVFLPRPFSLYDRAAGGSRGSFLLKAIGPGTKALAALRPGERVWVTGPLGRAFPQDIENPICIAGGIGLAPFLLLAQDLVARGKQSPRLLFGGRDRPALAGMEHFENIARVHACTDDGSFGFHGMVTNLLEDLLGKGEVKPGETVFCCGPDPMMHAVARMCGARDLRCYVSLETYMACGFGVCNGCSVKVQGERFGGWPYSKTCIEGPVYEACELSEFG